LANLAHRGGAGSEDNTGDGAGILLQIPDKFFRGVCPQIGIELPPEGQYGVGMTFMPLERSERRTIQAQIEAVVREEGQTVLGWRYIRHDPTRVYGAHQSPPYQSVFHRRRSGLSNLTLSVPLRHSQAREKPLIGKS
jgi:glutamate synthase domain-containing protein 1